MKKEIGWNFQKEMVKLFFNWGFTLKEESLDRVEKAVYSRVSTIGAIDEEDKEDYITFFIQHLAALKEEVQIGDFEKFSKSFQIGRDLLEVPEWFVKGFGIGLIIDDDDRDNEMLGISTEKAIESIDLKDGQFKYDLSFFEKLSETRWDEATKVKVIFDPGLKKRLLKALVFISYIELVVEMNKSMEIQWFTESIKKLIVANYYQIKC